MSRPQSINEIVVTLNGVPLPLGQIAATASTTNASTAVPFNTTAPFLAGKVLLINGTGSFYVACGRDSTVTATSANYQVAASTDCVIAMGDSYTHLAILPVSGTITVKVVELV